MIVVNTLDFAFPLPPQLFGGKQIILPPDNLPHEIPDYDYKQHYFPGIVVVEVPIPKPLPLPEIPLSFQAQIDNDLTIPILKTAAIKAIKKAEKNSKPLKGVYIKPKKREKLKRKYKDRFNYGQRPKQSI
jgi:hypothetical protein